MVSTFLCFCSTHFLSIFSLICSACGEDLLYHSLGKFQHVPCLKICSCERRTYLSYQFTKITTEKTLLLSSVKQEQSCKMLQQAYETQNNIKATLTKFVFRGPHGEALFVHLVVKRSMKTFSEIRFFKDYFAHFGLKTNIRTFFGDSLFR